jgi:hypothetical protein
MGYATPDIRFRFDGVAFDACSYQHIYRNPDIRFWAGPLEVMTRQEAETTLAKFVEDVIAQLGNKFVHRSSVELRWARSQASQADPDPASMADELNVSTEVVERQLKNQDRIRIVCN